MPFSTQDLFVILFLVFLEGILSIDNALVLAVLARGLPKEKQRKALTYGLAGAVIFRLLALSIVTHLIALNWVKYVGGGYLIFLALKHFIAGEKETEAKAVRKVSFWRVVLVIELTDIAFALDSILAAVALSSKFWVVFTGGILGVVMMRFAATLFIRVLRRFPGFETTAYLLVLVIGVKVIVEALHLPGIDFHSPRALSFWIFWAIMLACVLLGFLPHFRTKEEYDTERSLEKEAEISKGK